jgi:hypothetical protein
MCHVFYPSSTQTNTRGAIIRITTSAQGWREQTTSHHGSLGLVMMYVVFVSSIRYYPCIICRNYERFPAHVPETTRAQLGTAEQC